MTAPFTTYPAPAQSGIKTPDPADLWDYLVSKGLSEGDATRHVLRVLQNAPAEVQRQYLKDVDPGKLASFGLGAADMMSFGLGDQFARKLEGQEALDTQQAAQANHPTAHLLGEVAGLVGPAGIEYGLAKAGVIAPTALGRYIANIASRPARAAARTAVNAATGAAYAGAQAAGRTEGGLAPRAQAAGRAAPLGALIGGALPLAVSGAKATLGGWGNRLLDNLAGKTPAAVAMTPEAAQAAIQREMGAARVPGSPPNPASVEAIRLHEAGKISAAEMSRRIGLTLGQEPAGLLQPRLTPMPGQPQGLLGPEGISPAPRPSYPPTLAEMQGFNTAPREVIPRAGKPGHPVWQGEGSPTRSPEVRAGEPLVPSKHDVPPPSIPSGAAKILRGQSFAKLKATLALPETPQAVKQLILAEFQRRGIVVSP